MGARENKVETYLNDEVVKLGGLTRKWVSPGVDGVPDRIIFLKGRVFFVEVKTIDGTLSSVQVREQNRLREQGAIVFTAAGHEEVDIIIKAFASIK